MFPMRATEFTHSKPAIPTPTHREKGLFLVSSQREQVSSVLIYLFNSVAGSTSKSAYGTTTARTTIAMSTAAMLSSTTMKSTALLLAQQTTATATTQKKTHRVGHTIIKTASSEDNATKVGFPTRFLWDQILSFVKLFGCSVFLVWNFREVIFLGTVVK